MNRISPCARSVIWDARIGTTLLPVRMFERVISLTIMRLLHLLCLCPFGVSIMLLWHVVDVLLFCFVRTRKMERMWQRQYYQLYKCFADCRFFIPGILEKRTGGHTVQMESHQFWGWRGTTAAWIPYETSRFKVQKDSQSFWGTYYLHTNYNL